MLLYFFRMFQTFIDRFSLIDVRFEGCFVNLCIIFLFFYYQILIKGVELGKVGMFSYYIIEKGGEIVFGLFDMVYYFYFILFVF